MGLSFERPYPTRAATVNWSDQLKKSPEFTSTARDGVIFVFALAGLTYEAVVAKTPNPTLITGFFGLLGLPLVIRNDAARKKTAAGKKTTARRDRPAPSEDEET